MKSFKTLVNDTYKPKTISNNSIKLRYGPNESNKLHTMIDWEPAEGKPSFAILY